jgi:hypothetical protein
VELWVEKNFEEKLTEETDYIDTLLIQPLRTCIMFHEDRG